MTHFLLISLPLATFNNVTLICLCCTSFVPVVLTPAEQNFLPQTLLSVEIKAVFPPLKKRVLSPSTPFSVFTEVWLKPL